MSIPVDSLRSCMLTLAEECGTHSGLAPGRLGMVPSHKALAHSFALLHILGTCKGSAWPMDYPHFHEVCFEPLLGLSR